MKCGDSNAMAIHVLRDIDIVEVRTAARAMATQLGFSGADVVFIATAVSEVARNMIEYARCGEIAFSVVHREHGTCGIQIVARDQGPGIPNLAKAMEDGFSTSRGFGLGLPGARRLMDDFHMDSQPGSGTTVTMRKWLP
jgi:serine/threonine-protein kinase RsbT